MVATKVCHPKTLANELANRRFPFSAVDHEALKAEVEEAATEKSLPLVRFGWTGGYGIERLKLVNAVRLTDFREAALWYTELVAQAIIEAAIEAGVTLIEGAEILATNVDSLGRDKVQ